MGGFFALWAAKSGFLRTFRNPKPQILNRFILIAVRFQERLEDLGF